MSDKPWEDYKEKGPWDEYKGDTSTVDTIKDVGGQAVRQFNKALVTGAVKWPYEGVRHLLDKGVSIPGVGSASPGIKVPPVEENMYLGPLVKPYLNQPEAETTAGRYAGAIGEQLGYAALPSAGLLSAGQRMAAMAPTGLARAVGQTVAAPYAATPGAAVVADALASAGAGVGQQAAKDMGFGDTGQMVGGLAGSVGPLMAHAGFNAARNVIQESAHNATPAQRINKKLGDLGLEDFADAVSVGSTNANLANNRRVLDILGEEMTRHNGDRAAAEKATLERLEQAIIPESYDRASRELYTSAMRALQRGENPFPPGTPQSEIDNFLVSMADRNAVREPVGANATSRDVAPIREPAGADLFPTIAAGIDARARERAPELARDHLRRLVSTHADNNLFFGEYPAVVSGNMATRGMKPKLVPDELAGQADEVGTQQLLDYIANSSGLASAQNVRNAIGERSRGLRASTDDVIRNLSPNSQSIQDIRQMTDDAARMASNEYERIHNTPELVDNRILSGGLQGVVDKYLDKAANRSGEQADAIRAALKEFFIKLPNGQEIVMPTLLMSQDMRGALRGIISRNRQAGNDHIVSALQPIYNDVSAVMREASPEWAKVNRRWADMELEKRATELGDALSEKAGPKFREQMEEFKALAPEAQDIVRTHFTQKLLDKIENNWKLGGGRNLGEAFTKEHTRNMIRQILGDEAAVDVARLIRDLNVAARSRNNLKGSQTHVRGQIQKEEDADMHLVEAARNFDVKGWREALIARGLAIWRERRNKQMGRTLTTPMKNVPEVAQAIDQLKRARELAARYARPLAERGSFIPGISPQIGNILGALDDSDKP